MSVIRWEKPPATPSGRNRGKGETWRWNAVVDALATRPGEWALVAEDIQFATLVRLRQHGCETAARGVATNGRVAKAYARFLGGSGDRALKAPGQAIPIQITEVSEDGFFWTTQEVIDADAKQIDRIAIACMVAGDNGWTPDVWEGLEEETKEHWRRYARAMLAEFGLARSS